MAVQKKRQFIRKKEEVKKPLKKIAVKKTVKKAFTPPAIVKEESPVVTAASEPEVIENEVAKEPEEATESQEVDEKETKNDEVEKTADTEPEKKSEEKKWPDPMMFEEKKRGFFWQFILFVFIGFAIGSGFFLSQELLTKGIPAIKKAVPTTVIEDVRMPTEPPAKPSDPKTYTISVLNGSGKGGEAAKAKAALEEDGFTVENIDNADKSDYTQSLIQAKKGVTKEYSSKLKKSLEDNKYIVLDPETLSETEKYDVVVIIGAKRTE